jgi:hypothetical protein
MIRKCHNLSEQLIIKRRQEVNFLVVQEKLAAQLQGKYRVTFTLCLTLAQQSTKNFSFTEFSVCSVIEFRILVLEDLDVLEWEAVYFGVWFPILHLTDTRNQSSAHSASHL